MDVNTQGKPKAYLLWYKVDANATTEYIYIIAFSVKQAILFFDKQGYSKMYDYDKNPIDCIPSNNWLAKHEIGDILGQYATI